MAFIAHTAPEANIPSKNNPNAGCNPIKNVKGEKNKLIKNPTQVDVHITQLISPDKNLKSGDIIGIPTSAVLCIDLRKFSKIEP
jgi:hypothetical protein